MPTFQTINTRVTPYLYHWQRFVPEYLVPLLTDQTIFCSNPANFNDPWDCKPSYNTEILLDEGERERHLQWYIDVTKNRRSDISSEFITRTEQELRADPDLLKERIVECSEEMWSAIDQQYRVYCLCPDVSNSLMWAHYADCHRGICLEFSTRNFVMCCALRVEYSRDYPFMRLYSNDPFENLMPLLTKSDVWNYEQEYRLVAQEHRHRTDDDTLITHNNDLKLPDRALISIIVGCQGPYEDVNTLVQKYAPQVKVRRALRLPNRYDLKID